MSKVQPITNTVSIPVAAPQEDPRKIIKQGHSFLGCMCDMRRAVIMIDVLCLIFAASGLILIILTEKYGDKIDPKDMEYIHLHSTTVNFPFSVALSLQISAMLVYIFSIIGACNFSICPVLTACAWIIAFIVMDGINKTWVSFGLHIFFLYPHVVLCYELAKRIMTRDNYYQSERQSCCCV